MTVYVVSYDLRQPGRDYQPLWNRLAEWKGVRLLESLWVMDTEAKASAIRDDLKGYIDSNDGLFIAALTGETAWHKLKGQSDQFLTKRFGS